MYVCICNAVTESSVHACVEQGAHDTWAVVERTQAGTGCGSCLLRLGEVVDEALRACPRRLAAAAS